MPIIFNDSHNPYFNLATEEVLFRNDFYGEDIFLIWESEPAFILGRNQNPFIEINPEFFQKNIPIIRRISGGGTIYQDLGTLNFSFITNNYESRINDYEYFLEPIITVLKKLGVAAYFVPKSHLYVDKAKISGNAQAFANNRLLHHGTLLYNTNTNIINQALVKYESRIKTNQVLSKKQEVINLQSLFKESYQYEGLKSLIIDSYVKMRGVNPKIAILDAEMIHSINILVNEKYKTWDWNFGKASDFDLPIPINGEQVKLKIVKGIISSVDKREFSHLLGLKLYSQEYFKKI